MRCTNCGADIPEGMLICPDCRTEVQMVPDYNPLEDILAREVRGSVEDATRPIRPDDIRRYRERTGREGGNATRVLSQGELDHIRSGKATGAGNRTEVWRQKDGGTRTRAINRVSPETGAYRRQSGTTEIRNGGNTVQSRTDGIRQNTGRVRQNTDRVRQNTGGIRQNTGTIRREADDRRRQQMLKKKQAAKRRRRAVIFVMIFILLLLGGSGFILYQNSYGGIVGKGYRALQSGEYSAAEKAFQRAIRKDSKKAEAYTGMAEVYIQQEDMEQAEDVFLKACDSQPSNADIYQAAIEFYVKTEQVEKISSILEGCDDRVLSAVSDYVSDMPSFSLEEGTYPEVQEVSLSGNGTIYYTTDDTEPTEKSTKYEEPILLDEGTTTIRAVTYNKKGVPSLISSRTYTVEIPIEDAPAVTPSTGRYTTATQITIQVPEGYKAYYTTDGTTPSAGSVLYTGPIDMPAGSTVFSAVLISDSGRMTQVTKRTYLLEQE